MLPHEKLMNEVGPALLSAVEEIRVAVGAVAHVPRVAGIRDEINTRTIETPPKGRTTTVKREKLEVSAPRALVRPGTIAKAAARRSRARL